MLLVGDLHLTSLPRDAYRWRVFKKLHSIIEAHKQKEVVLLGDITDAKDHHPAELVNRICDQVVLLANKVQVHVLRGNHDGIDPLWPYFRFLRDLRGVHFYEQPCEMSGHRGIVMLPHSRNPELDWKHLNFKQAGYNTCFAHVTVEGSQSESGISLEGVDAGFFRDVQCFAGDVHVPHQVGKVVYVGAPYPIHFGDQFDPRVIIFDPKETRFWQSIPLKSIRRLMIDIKDASELAQVKFRLGDQIKVRIHLPQERLGEWSKQRADILEQLRGMEVASVEVQQEQATTRPRLRIAKLQNAQEVLEEFLYRNRQIKPALAALGKKVLKAVLQR